MAKLTSVFLRNMLKYVTVKSCIFCSKLQYSDDHRFVNKKSACTYWGNFVFYIQKLVIWTKWCYFLRFLISITLFSGFSWKSVIVTWKRKKSFIWFIEPIFDGIWQNFLNKYEYFFNEENFEHLSIVILNTNHNIFLSST